MRNHIYHVITPFSRMENYPVLKAMLDAQRVEWHVVVDEGSAATFPCLRCPRAPELWNPGGWIFNWFIRNEEIHDGDRYSYLSDDDFYEPGFFDKIDARAGEALVVSMNRGQHQTPNPGYPADTLVGCPENIHHGKIGMEQIIVSGKVLRQHRHGRGADGDWDFISSVVHCHPPAFVPEAFVWFNYLEPGRWDA